MCWCRAPTSAGAMAFWAALPALGTPGWHGDPGSSPRLGSLKTSGSSHSAEGTGHDVTSPCQVSKAQESLEA